MMAAAVRTSTKRHPIIFLNMWQNNCSGNGCSTLAEVGSGPLLSSRWIRGRSTSPPPSTSVTSTSTCGTAFWWPGPVHDGICETDFFYRFAGTMADFVEFKGGNRGRTLPPIFLISAFYKFLYPFHIYPIFFSSNHPYTLVIYVYIFTYLVPFISLDFGLFLVKFGQTG